MGIRENTFRQILLKGITALYTKVTDVSLQRVKKKEAWETSSNLADCWFQKVTEIVSNCKIRKVRVEGVSNAVHLMSCIMLMSCMKPRYVFFFAVAFSHFKTSKWGRMLLAVLLRSSKKHFVDFTSTNFPLARGRVEIMIEFKFKNCKKEHLNNCFHLLPLCN